MSAEEPTLLDVVRVLSDTYKDQGVMIWLRAKNHWLTQNGERFSPAQYIDAGRIAEVYEAACRIEGAS